METAVWVYAETRNGRLAKVTLELLGKATELGQQLGTGVASVLVGNGVERLTDELCTYGCDEVYLADDPRLELYQSEAYASVVAGLLQEHRPDIFLLGATDSGRDLAPRVAAKLATGLTAHCADIKLEEHNGTLLLHQIVPGWGSSSIMVDMVCLQKRPQMATIKPGIFDLPTAKKGKTGETIRIAAQLSDKCFRAETLEVSEERPGGITLEEAENVVALGWGVHAAGVFKLAQELADVLGAAVGGTRPMADAGWIAEDRMIGQSGKIVSPGLFISLGASGAMHFTTGFAKSKFILAVDQNPKAPIFDMADIGIIADLREALPHLIAEFRNLSRPER